MAFKEFEDVSVELIQYTQNAEEVLMFSKDTRLMESIFDFREKFRIQGEEREEELDKIFSTISTPLEFIDYIFLITNVTRAFTHQLVRHRVGVSFAQQSQRVANMSNFGYMTPGSICEKALSDYQGTMLEIEKGYKNMIDLGVPKQDARGVLPTNVYTNILMKINLRALIDMSRVRLCVRAQGEFQKAVMLIREEVARVHPWAEEHIAPLCVAKGVCYFPRFDRCPIKKTRPWLNGPSKSMKEKIESDWKKIVGKYCPQPIGGGR